MKYLIVRCNELRDPFECDADREPIIMTDDWRQWAEKNSPKYDFEVWEYSEKDKKFYCIKDYNEYLEAGMAFYWWDDEEDEDEVPPHIIAKFPNTNQDSKIPEIVEKAMNGMTEEENDFYNGLCYSEHITWWNNGKTYVYGYYHDNHYSRGY